MKIAIFSCGLSFRFVTFFRYIIGKFLKIFLIVWNYESEKNVTILNCNPCVVFTD